jgi:hypothetical protein
MRTELLPKFTAGFDIPVEFRPAGVMKRGAAKGVTTGWVLSLAVLMHGIDTTVALCKRKPEA